MITFEVDLWQQVVGRERTWLAIVVQVAVRSSPVL